MVPQSIRCLREDFFVQNVIEKTHDSHTPVTQAHVSIHFMDHHSKKSVEFVHSILVHATPFTTNRAEKRAKEQRGQVCTPTMWNQRVVLFLLVFRLIIIFDLFIFHFFWLFFILVLVKLLTKRIFDFFHGDTIFVVIVNRFILVSFFHLSIHAIIVVAVHIQIHPGCIFIILFCSGHAPNQLGQLLAQFTLNRNLVGHVKRVPQGLPQFEKV